MRALQISVVCAFALGGCIGQPLTIGAAPTPQDAARATCLANFGLTDGASDALTDDQTRQLNGCIAQSLADTSVASGGLVPLVPLEPVATITAEPVPTEIAVADNPNFQAATGVCVPGGGVMQGGTIYCTQRGFE